MRRVLAVLGLALFGASPVLGDVKLPAILGPNMVVQQDRELPFWGTADPGEPVTVTLGEAKQSATADAQGKWMLKLPPQKAGGPVEITVAGTNALKLTNVLVGEVWVCSGQSNMAMSLSGSHNAPQEIAAAKFPQIRLFTVARKTALTPRADCQGSWVECEPKVAGGFSAVGYFFGRKLHQELKVPVGLINSSWGGTPADAWTERSFLESDPMLRPIVERWAKVAEEYPKALEAHKAKVAAWQAQVNKAKADAKAATEAWAKRESEAKATAKAEGKPYVPAKDRPAPPKLPPAPRGPQGADSPHNASSLYNGMVHPLLPFPVQGALWYQGESNAGRAFQYRTLLPAMVRSWRKAWGDEDLDFFIVQLASFKGVVKDPPAPSADWAELREAQTMTCALPKTGLACLIDIGEANDIHPKNKQDVGLRLALAALGTTYGQKIATSGPVFDSMAVEGSAIRVKFQHVAGGLVARPFTNPVTENGPTLEKRFGMALPPDVRGKGELKGFALAGEDRKFVWADAKIDGETVIVSSPTVPKPVAVRYAWENNPICNLYNQAGLPAVPFRTDTWPGVTDSNR